MSETAQRDGVFIDESAHEVYRALTEGTDAVGVPFRTMKDVFLWAAVLGHQGGLRKSIVGRRTLVFRWAQFSSQVDVPLLKALALAEGDSLNPLADRDAILTAAEEYANGGIRELKAKVLDYQGQPLWNLIALIPEHGMGEEA
jgi:dnd system-associated protein 4